MKVLVFGASGFIGFPVSQALSRAGHTVYGVTRSATKAKKLAADEVFPIIGDPKDTKTWAHLIPTIDVVIEAIGGSADLRTIGLNLLNAIAEIAKSTRPVPGSPEISFIYTSGVWVHGSSREDIVSDTTPLSNPIPFVAWRPAVEEAVCNHTELNGIVIRPALVYGRSASLFEPVFEAAESGRRVAWYGTPGGRFSLIHTDDLADVYVRAVEKAQILGRLAIDVSNETTESIEDFLQTLIRISGNKESHRWIEPMSPHEEALASTVLTRPYLAKSLLGWQQKKPGLIDGLPMYYAAWKASRDDQPKEKFFPTRI